MITDINTIAVTQITASENTESEKENAPEETRPVEDISESQDSKLDNDKKNTEKQDPADHTAKDCAVENGTYDAAGNLSESMTADSLSGGQGKRINLVI